MAKALLNEAPETAGSGGPRTEWIPCNACGADSFKRLSVVDGWHIGRCQSCGLVYVNPIPFFEPTAAFSEISLNFQYTRFQHEITQDVVEHDRNQMRAQFAKLGDLAGFRGTGRLLDVGCGSGSSVCAAVDLGWQATGIDLDPALVELGRSKLQVDLRCAALLESGLEDGSYDFIRMRDVIEHLPNPHAILLKVKDLLRPGGVVLVVTPNEDSLATQLRWRLGARRDKVATVAPPHHLHGFGPSTLRLLLDRAGMTALEVTTRTPVDRAYGTARNMQSASRKLHVGLWRAAEAIGRGSLLVAWARKAG